ncbi:hypothetical protein [Nocardiopsis metallicus]|uniref:Uncharacterized protein n=1 Tax=Nocardiopsis metallicus TaxID=179819 RepID=A0A840W7J7_9ACTN|nr:hypothetical protein [Nocardiopsis metallicus]MBB5491323.1 hypothetical protein [Nocardiopsis metallicus]
MGPEQIEMPSLMDAAKVLLDDSVHPTSAEQALVSETCPYKFEIDETAPQQVANERRPGLGE